MSWDAIDSQTNACKKFQRSKYHILYINQLWPIETWYVTLSCNYHMVVSWYGFGRVPCSLPCFPILFNWNTSYEYYKLEHRFQWHKFGSKVGAPYPGLASASIQLCLLHFINVAKQLLVLFGPCIPDMFKLSCFWMYAKTWWSPYTISTTQSSKIFSRITGVSSSSLFYLTKKLLNFATSTSPIFHKCCLRHICIEA